ncbi:N2,N2-dimethylguanosine tRNA methyltransferase-domain-containing protein [Kalaharituber pfeilii]|nr:N2,N2-dimethylguanosine tRNA methyltransferase-domain-containing protein [Kalaharituber pfeilii]
MGVRHLCSWITRARASTTVSNRKFFFVILGLSYHPVFTFSRRISDMADLSKDPSGTPSHPQPKKSESITIEEQGQRREYTAITEGKATILFPGGGEVFYNPIQNFNRDLSVLAIKCFGKQWLEDKDKRRRKKKVKNVDKSDAPNTKAEVSQWKEEEGQAEGSNAPGSVTQKGPVDDGAMDVEPKEFAQSKQPSRDQSSCQNIPPFRILDALSATGLRALRYAHEIPFTTEITANDLSASAVDSIYRNIEYNRALNPSAMAKITATTENANTHMYISSYKYHVIDLDPYGTAAPFLDASLQAIVTRDSGTGSTSGGSGGLLCVTCTDAGVWAAAGYSEKCYALYGGHPLKGECSHEAGLRLILNSIAMTAAKYGLSIEPLLSLSIDFYARVFVQVKKSQLEVKNVASKSMLVYNCDSGCGAWKSVSLGQAKEIPTKNGNGTYKKYGLPQAPDFDGNCEHCGFRMHIAGPMWAGELHNPEFLNALLETLDEADPEVYTTLPRIRGMISTALNECTFMNTLPTPITKPEGVDIEGVSHVEETKEPRMKANVRSTPPYPPLENPYFFLIPTKLSKMLHTIAPPQAALRGALMELGYAVGRSHCKPNSIKTTAPYVVVWEVMRQFISKYSPIKESGIVSGSPGYRLLRGPPGGDGKTPKGWEEVAQQVGDIAFDEVLGKDEARVKGDVMKKEIRYQQNPTAHWGPMRAAKSSPHPPKVKVTVGNKRKGTERDAADDDVEKGGESCTEELPVVEEKKVKLDHTSA